MKNRLIKCPVCGGVDIEIEQTIPLTFVFTQNKDGVSTENMEVEMQTDQRVYSLIYFYCLSCKHQWKEDGLFHDLSIFEMISDQDIRLSFTTNLRKEGLLDIRE